VRRASAVLLGRRGRTSATGNRTGGDLAQQPAHDLAAARLRQRVGEAGIMVLTTDGPAAARGRESMAIVTRGSVRNGAIVPHEPLTLPDGTEVVVSIEPAEARFDADADRRLAEFDGLGFHGMWADREDMADSVAWVRKVQEQWQQRLSRQG
jgi:hypothetical protein